MYETRHVVDGKVQNGVRRKTGTREALTTRYGSCFHLPGLLGLRLIFWDGGGRQGDGQGS